MTDPYWPTVRQWCQQHDLPVIGYHYVATDNPAAQARTWLGNNGGTVAMLDWEESGGDLSNLTAVVDAFNAAGITVQLGYYPRWYWSRVGGGNLSHLANALVASAYPDGSGYASTVYVRSGGDSGAGWAPYGGATPAAWQFTSSANIAGFRVDCNAYRGTTSGSCSERRRCPFSFQLASVTWGNANSIRMFTNLAVLGRDGVSVRQHPNYNVALGEQLILDTYRAVADGPGWATTLLIVTYDEHGGCYDHIAPPATATPPDDTIGEYGFDFTRFGPRVPTVLVSPLIEAGTVFRVPTWAHPLGSHQHPGHHRAPLVATVFDPS